MKAKLNDSLFGAFEMNTSEMNQIKGGVEVYYSGIGLHGNGRKVRDWIYVDGHDFWMDWEYV